MRYLVTGGAGFIGSHLVDALLEDGDEVLVLDDLSTGRSENIRAALETGGAELAEGSILDEALVAECMDGVDACFHLASAVGVKLILEEPLDSLRRNVLGSEIVIGAAASQRKRLLFASSSEIYGKDSDDALSESSDRLLGAPDTLRWSYATAKAFGESLVHAHQRSSGYAGVIVRPFNTVGPRQAGRYGMVLPRFIRQAITGDDLTVFGDGAQSRCFTHVSDTVTAMRTLLKSDEAMGGTFNVGSPAEVPIIELARQVIERTGTSSDITFVPYARAYGEDFEELGRRKPDITAIEKAVGWEPGRSLTEMIDDTLVFERQKDVASSPDEHPARVG